MIIQDAQTNTESFLAYKQLQSIGLTKSYIPGCIALGIDYLDDYYIDYDFTRNKPWQLIYKHTGKIIKQSIWLIDVICHFNDWQEDEGKDYPHCDVFGGPGSMKDAYFWHKAFREHNRNLVTLYDFNLDTYAYACLLA